MSCTSEPMDELIARLREINKEESKKEVSK
jgi:hypothetical protein